MIIYYVNGPCHVSGNFLPFKGKSHSLYSQAARFFSLAKGKKGLIINFDWRLPSYKKKMYFLKQFRQPYFKRPQIVVWKRTIKAECRWLQMSAERTFLSSNVVILKCRWHGPMSTCQWNLIYDLKKRFSHKNKLECSLYNKNSCIGKPLVLEYYRGKMVNLQLLHSRCPKDVNCKNETPKGRHDIIVQLVVGGTWWVC
jgi:hypothetical protein